MLREDSLAEMLVQERDQMAEGPGSLSVDVYPAETWRSGAVPLVIWSTSVY